MSPCSIVLLFLGKCITVMLVVFWSHWKSAENIALLVSASHTLLHLVQEHRKAWREGGHQHPFLPNKAGKQVEHPSSGPWLTQACVWERAPRLHWCLNLKSSDNPCVVPGMPSACSQTEMDSFCSTKQKNTSVFFSKPKVGKGRKWKEMDAVMLVDVGVATVMTAAVGDDLFVVDRHGDISWCCFPPLWAVDTQLRTESLPVTPARVLLFVRWGGELHRCAEYQHLEHHFQVCKQCFFVNVAHVEPNVFRIIAPMSEMEKRICRMSSVSCSAADYLLL